MSQWKPSAAAAKSCQSCPTLRDPVDCSLPGCSIHGISQARVLEWVAIAFSWKPSISSINGKKISDNKKLGTGSEM